MEQLAGVGGDQHENIDVHVLLELEVVLFVLQPWQSLDVF